MASKTHDAGKASEAGTRALDGLYAAPFDDFVPRRRELAAALRAAGDVAASRLVAAASKPSRTAWALNQVARRRPDLVAAAFEARAKAEAAQTTGEGEALRTTARAYRDRLADLVQAAGDAVREDGGELTVTQGRRISASVQAVAGADAAEMREALLAGRLVADVDVDDPFAGLELGPAGEAREAAAPARDDLAARRAAAQAGRAREREQPGADARREQERRAREQREQGEQARAREQQRHARELEKAREQVVALEKEAREARLAARDAEIAAGRAQAEAERLRRAVEAVEKRLGAAKEELRTRAK
jgi:hypothetical protein